MGRHDISRDRYAPAAVERVIKKLASKYEKVRICYEAGRIDVRTSKIKLMVVGPRDYSKDHPGYEMGSLRLEAENSPLSLFDQTSSTDSCGVCQVKRDSATQTRVRSNSKFLEVSRDGHRAFVAIVTHLPICRTF